MSFSSRRAAAIALRQYYLIHGSFARLVPMSAWVAVDIILWGFITKYLNTVTAPGFNFVPALLGAVLMSDFFGRVMHGVTTAFLEDVWSRNFPNIFASPLSIWEYLAGLVTTSVATSTIGLTVMLLLASAAFGLSFAAYGAAFVPFLLILFLFGIALGIAASAVVLRMGPASEWFVWPIPVVISPFAGVFYPVSTLPWWMQGFSRLLPASYVFEAMRGVVAGRGVSFGALAIGGTLAVIYTIGACWLFARVHRQAVRSGLIARYSAENVS
jgi:ABC-2 type transport system permease protein